MRNSHTDQAWRLILERSAIVEDSDYAEFISRHSLSYYRQRAINVGFAGLKRVLDVGCGHGHWTCALSTLNDEVIGIDIHRERVTTASHLIRDLWIDNASVKVADATSLPFPSNWFDGLFCYGVFMFLNPEKALAEYRRVLKPGGRLYLCTNGPGWWLQLALRNIFQNRSIVKSSISALLNRNIPGTPTSFSCTEIKDLLEQCCFEDIQVAPEGSLFVSSDTSAYTASVYKPTFFGLDNVIELTARSPTAVHSLLMHKDSPLFREIKNSIASPPPSSISSLSRYVVSDSGDTTHASHLSRLSYVKACAAGVDRHQYLKICGDLIIDKCDNDLSRLRAIFQFCQKHFYHHFATQPLLDGLLIDDPVELLMMRAIRCGSTARVLVDLLEVAGYQGGLIAGSCHTAAEVYFDGHWRLLDPSLYPTGQWLEDESGKPICTSEIISDPSILDHLPSYINYNVDHVDAFFTQYPKTAASIEKFLRHPILPSVAYFGGEFAGSRAGSLQRYRKRTSPDQKLSSWTSIQLDDELPAPIVPTIYRPEQVRKIELQGSVLSWSCSSTAVPGSPVIYDVHIHSSSRGWAYDRLHTECSFTVPGKTLRTSSNSADVANLLNPGVNYITLIARNPLCMGCFHLPSNEFIVNASSELAPIKS